MATNKSKVIVISDRQNEIVNEIRKLFIEYLAISGANGHECDHIAFDYQNGEYAAFATGETINVLKAALDSV